MDEPRLDEATGQTTTGHSYDGIEELNTPLPRWWLWTFYITIIWGVAYTIAFPAWPLISSATSGLLGYSTRGELVEDVAAHEAQNSELVAQLVAADLNELEPFDDLHRYAVARGGAVYRAQCSQCHGSGAAGGIGYPNLLDNDWLWGGQLDEIAYTVRHGIRNENDFDARYSQMSAYRDILEPAEIEAVADYVLSLNTTPIEGQGATIFAEQCAACHGDAGLGDHDLGAPNLADNIWLYGGERDTVIESITNARFGVMPAWGLRLSEEDVRAVSVYVHSLGGGE